MTGDQKISHCSHLQRDNSAHSSQLRVGVYYSQLRMKSRLFLNKLLLRAPEAEVTGESIRQSRVVIDEGFDVDARHATVIQ